MSEVQLKRGRQNTLTTQMIFESETIGQLRGNIALSLLAGSFNSLRQYSKQRQPIDLERLKVLQGKFDDLISEVENEMSVNILEVENF